MNPAARSLLSEVMAEARRLGLAWWERLALILAVAVLIVFGKRAMDALRNVAITSPEPRAADPERDPSLPPAVAVDGNGDPVGFGGPPDERESGSGG